VAPVLLKTSGAVDRGDDDDGAAAGALEVRHAEVQGQEGAAQIDVDRTIPLLGLQLVDRRPDAVDAGVRHDDIETAIALGEFINRPSQRGVLGDIGCKRQRLAPGLPDLFRGVADFVGRVAECTYACTLACQQNGGGLADAGPGAGHQRYSSLKLHLAILPGTITKAREEAFP
jgi:hypothetical protein